MFFLQFVFLVSHLMGRLSKINKQKVMNKPGNLRVYNCHQYVRKQYYIAHVTHCQLLQELYLYRHTDSDLTERNASPCL